MPPDGDDIRQMSEMAERFDALLARAGMTQKELEARSNGRVLQSTVSRIKNGERRGKHETRATIAGILGLTVEAFDAYMEGSMPIESLRFVAHAASSVTRIVRDPAPPVATQDDDTPLEAALIQALGAGRHKASDYDAARAAVRYVSHMLEPDADLLDLATGYLDAAKWLRERGQRTGPQEVAARFGVARAKVRPEVLEQLTSDATAEARRFAAEWKPDSDWIAKAKAESETPGPFAGTTPTTPVLPPTRSGKRGK